jgi:ribonuclease-3
MVKDAGTNDKLQRVAKDWNLSNWLKENPCQAGQEPRITLASTVEALIGAVWVDCNRDLAEVQHVIELLQA